MTTLRFGRLRPVCGLQHIVAVLVAIAGCGDGGDRLSSGLAQCACSAAGPPCTIDSGAQCAIDDATGDYSILNATDVTARDGVAVYYVYDRSSLTFAGGEASRMFLADEAAVILDNGLLVSGVLKADAMMTVSGATAVNVSLEGTAEITIAEGTVAELFVLEESSGRMFGGTIVRLSVERDAALAVEDGRVPNEATTSGRASLQISGGFVQLIEAFDESMVSISGGEVPDMRLNNAARAVLRGGTVQSVNSTGERSALTVVGSELDFPYGLVPVSGLTPTETVGIWQAQITGRFPNGDRIHTFVNVHTDANLYLCAPDAAGNCRCPIEDFEAGTCEP